MTKTLFFLLLLTAASAFSQESQENITYFDSILTPTSKDNHHFYRIVSNDRADGSYTERYYYRSGELYSEGAVADQRYARKQGEHTTFYKNGNKKDLTFYEKGSPGGNYISWYENGHKKMEATYLDAQLRKQLGYEKKIVNYWNPENKQTVISGTGTYDDTDGNTISTGAINNGLRDKVWSGRDILLKYTFTETYDAGVLASGESTDSLSSKRSYDVLSIKPDAKGGISTFYKHVMNNLNLPNDAKDIKGTIFLRFTIDTNGQATDFEIIRGLGSGLDEEAVRVIKSFPGWTPGIVRGIPTSVKFSMPLTFQGS
jgi:TonB family protein